MHPDEDEVAVAAFRVVLEDTGAECVVVHCFRGWGLAIKNRGLQPIGWRNILLCSDSVRSCVKSMSDVRY